MSRDRHRPFHGLHAAAPPTGLRERALAAARAAASRRREPGDRAREPGRALTDRLWESRPLRFAWALACAALVGVNLYLDRGAPERPSEDRVAGATQHPRTAADPSGPAPRTLLAARGEVLRALLEDPLGTGTDQTSTDDPRRTP